MGCAVMNRNIEYLTRTIEQLREDQGRRQAPQEETRTPQPEAMDIAPQTTSGVKRTAPEEGHSSGEETAQTVKKAAKPSTSRQVSMEANTVQRGAASPVSDAPKEPKVPPIILRKKENWSAVSSQLKRKGASQRQGRPGGERSIGPKNISGEVTAASLTAALAQMQQMCSAMGVFFAQMPALLKR